MQHDRVRSKLLHEREASGTGSWCPARSDGVFTPDEVPVTDFLVRNFAVCDHWFSSIPASTQPNRLMAMSGYTLTDGNVDVLKDQYLVYDWLNDHRVSWTRLS